MSASFAERVLAWYDVYGRHDLPWQLNPTPYRVWISEIMLQQTQVATVIPYYQRFVQRFPDVRTLASAADDEVLHLWSGLGYYARARHLHAAARRICEAHQGELPERPDALEALPGIGRSTAAAILSLAHDQRHAILDGNVKRVLARHSAVAGWPGSTKVLRELWSLAERHTPDSRAAAYTQAMMDLGATVCTRTKPACEACPVNEDCAARRSGRQTEFPGRRRARTLPERRTRMLIVTDTDGQVLLERRPAAGIWGGLWSFPELGDEDDARAWIRDRLACEASDHVVWPVFRHTFTHFHLDITPERLTLDAVPAGVMEGGTRLWYNTRSPARLGIAAPVKTLLSNLDEDDGTDSQLRSAG